MSIREFSRRTEIPYRTLQDYLAGKRLPGAKRLARMSAFGVDLNWLLTGRLRTTMPTSVHEESDRGGIDAIGADMSLLEDLWGAALRDADAYASRFLRRTGTPLLPSQGLTAVEYFFRLKLRTAAAMAKHLETLRQDGVANDLIVDILTPASIADLDPTVDQLVASDKGPK